MSILSRIFLVLIRGYQFTLSTVMGKQCRFYPTCSVYTSQSIHEYGALKGGWMGFKRILRCNPWNAGGVDHVPKKTADNSCDKHVTCDKTSYL